MKDPVGTMPTRGETLPWWKFPHKPKVVFQQPVRSLEGFATLAAAPYTSNIVSTGTGTPKAFPTFGAAGTTASKVDQLNAFYAITAPYDTIYNTVKNYVTDAATGKIKEFQNAYTALNTYAPASYTDKLTVDAANTDAITDTSTLNGIVSDITEFARIAKKYIDATTALFNGVKGDLVTKVAEYSDLYNRYNQFKTDQANVDKSAGVDTLELFGADITNSLTSTTVQGYTYTTANVATLQGNCSTYLASGGLRDKIRTHVQTELRDFITKFDTAYSGLAPSVKDANRYKTRLPEVAEEQTPSIDTLISIINAFGGYSSEELAAAAPTGTAGKLTTWLLMQDYSLLYDDRLLFTMTSPPAITATPNQASISGLITDSSNFMTNINAVLSPTATQASIQAIYDQYNTNITNWLSISRTNLANIKANYASIHTTYTALQSSFNGFKAMAPIPLGTLPATLSDTVPAAMTYVSTGASGDKITVAGVTSTGGFTEYNTFDASRTNILDKFRQLVKHVSENVYGLIDQTGAADMTTVPATRATDMAALYSSTAPPSAKPDPTNTATSTVNAVSSMCDTLVTSMKKYAHLIAADVTGKYNTLWDNNSTFLTGAKETPAVSTETSDVSVTGPIYTSFTGKLSSLFSTLLNTMKTNVGNYNKLWQAYTDFKTNTASDAVSPKVTPLPADVSAKITGILADGTTFTSTNAGTLTSQLSNVGLDLTVSGTGKLPTVRSHVIGQLRTYIGNYETYRDGLTDVRTRGAYTSSLPIADSATAANVIGILAKYGGPLSAETDATYSGPSEGGTLNTQVLQDRMLDRIDDYVQRTEPPITPGLMSGDTIAILTSEDEAVTIATTDTPAPPGGFTLKSIITGESGATTGFDNTNYTTFTDAQLNTKITKYETALTTGITTVRDRIQAIKTSYESVWDAYDTFRTGFNAFSSLPALTTTKEPTEITKKYSVIQGLSTYNAANFPTDIGKINGVRDAYVGSSPQGLRPALITEFGTKLGTASGYAKTLQTCITNSALPAANKPTMPTTLVASPTDDQLKTYMTDLQKATVTLVVREYVQLYDNWFSTLTDAEKATAVSGSTYEGLKASLTTSYVPPADASFATVLATYTAGNTGLQGLVKAKAQGVLTSFKTLYDDNKNQGLFTDTTYATKASSAASPAGTNYAAITNDTTTNQQTAKTQYDNYIADRDSLIEEIRGKLKAVVDKYATLYNRYETFKTTQTSATIDSFPTTPSTYAVVAQDSTDLTPTFTYSDANKGTIDRLRGKYGQNNVGAASNDAATNIFPQFLFFVRFELDDYITKYGTESVKSQYDRTRPPSVSAPSADTATDADTLIAIMDAYGPVTAKLLLAGSQSAVYDLITRFNTTLFYSYVYVLTEADLSTQVTGYDTIQNFIRTIVGQDLVSYSTADETATQALSAKYNAAIAKLYEVLVDRLGTIKGNYETLHDAYTAFQTGFTSFKTMAALPAGVPKTPADGSATLPSNTYADGSFTTNVATIGTFYNKYVTASTGLVDMIKGHIATNVTNTGAYLTEYGTRLGSSKAATKPAAVTAPSSPDLENLKTMLETLALNTATLVYRNYQYLYTANSALVNTSMVVYGSTTASEANGAAAPSGADIAALGSTYDNYKTACETLFGTRTSNDGTVTGQLAYLKSEYNALRSKYTTFKGDSATQAAAGNPTLATLPATTPEETTTIPTTYSDTHVGAVDTLRGSLGTSDSTSTGSAKFPLLLAFVKGELTKYINAFKVKFDAADARFRGTYDSYGADLDAVAAAATTTALSLRNIMNGYLGTSDEEGVVAAPGLAAALTTANNRLAALNAISLFVETYGKFSTMLAAQGYSVPTEYTNLTNYFDLYAVDGTDPTMGDLKTGSDTVLANIKSTYDTAQTTLLGNVRVALTKVIDDFATDYADAPSTALRALPGISLPTSLKSYDKTSDRNEVNQQATTIERLETIMNNYIGATGYAPTMASTEASLSGTRTKRGDLLTAMSTYYVDNYLPFKDVLKDNKPSTYTDYNPTLLSQLTSYIDFSSNPIGFQNTFYNLSDSDLGSMKTEYENGVSTLLSEARVRVTKRINDFVGYYKLNKNLIDLPGINLDFLTIDGKTAWGTGTDADYGTDGFIKADLDSITETMTVSELKALQDKYSGTLTTGLKKQLADALGPLARTNELRGQIRNNFNTYYNLFDAFDTNVFKRYNPATQTNVQDISAENNKYRYNIPDEKYSFVKNYEKPVGKSTWELTAAAQALNNTDLETLKARFSSESADSLQALAYNALITDIKRKLKDVIGNFNTEATTTDNAAALQALSDRGTLPSELSDIPKTNRDDLAIVNGTPSLTDLHDLKNKYYGGSAGAGGSRDYPNGLFSILSNATSLGSGSLLKRQAAGESINAFDQEWQKFRLTLFTKADSTLDLSKLSSQVKACLTLNSTGAGGLYTTGPGGGKKPNSTYLGKDDGALDSLKTQFDNALANLATDVANEINSRIQSDYIDKFSEVDTAYRLTITRSNNVERNSVFVNLVSSQFPTLVTTSTATTDKTDVTSAGSSKNFTSLKEYMEKYLTSNNSGQFLVNTLQSAIDAGKLKDAKDKAKDAMEDYYVDTYLVYDDILGYTQATYPQALKDIVGNGTNGYIQVASTGYLTGTKFLELNSIALAQGAETTYRNAITALLGVAKGKVRDVINEYSTLLTDYETFRMDVGTAAVPTYPINLTNPANQASSDVGTLNGAGVSADTIRGFFDTYADPTSGKRDALVTFVRNQLTSYIGTFYGSYNTSDQRIRAMLSSYNVSTYNTDNGAIGTASMADMKTMMTRYAGYKVSLATASVRYEVVLAIEEYVDLLLEYKSMGLWTGPEPSEYTKISTDYFELESSKPGYPYKPSFLAITDSAQLTQIKNDYEGYKNNLSTQVVGNIEEKIQAMFTFYDLIHGDDVLSSGLSDILNSTVSTLTDDMKYLDIVQARDYVMTDDIATKIQEMNTFIYKADLMITGRDYQQCLQKRIETANTSVWSSLMSGFGF